ncbi:MAG: hypothetical protein IPK95_08750 [Cellvibrionales bacterium]|nr:hypothetical protein [Cellvibrionales bacterium]
MVFRHIVDFYGRLGRWTRVFIGCLLLVLALALYKFLQIRQLIAFAESFPEASETVEAFLVQPQSWHDTTTTVGEVLAPQAMELRNEVEGRVSAVGFNAGDSIKKTRCWYSWMPVKKLHKCGLRRPMQNWHKLHWLDTRN